MSFSNVFIIVLNEGVGDMETKWIYLIVGIIWAIILLYFVVMGGRHKNKPNPKFDKVPIILSWSVAGLFGILAIIGYFFF